MAKQSIHEEVQDQTNNKDSVNASFDDHCLNEIHRIKGLLP